MLREISQPDVILGNPAIAAPIAAGEVQAGILSDEIDALEADLHILTSTERGIARREKILKITPLDTDTLEERRYKVLVNWYDTYPYTRRDLVSRLKRLVGEGEFTFNLDTQARTLDIRIKLTSKKDEAVIIKLIDDIVPLDIVLTVKLLYRTWASFPGAKWDDFAGMTWYEMGTLEE